MAGSRRVKQKLVGLLQPGSHVGWTWTSLLIQSHSFLFFSKTVTPHLLLLSSSLLLFANLSEITSGVCFCALSESDNSTGTSGAEITESPCESPSSLLFPHSLFFLSLAERNSEPMIFSFFPLKDEKNRHRQEEDHWDGWPH